MSTPMEALYSVRDSDVYRQRDLASLEPAMLRVMLRAAGLPIARTLRDVAEREMEVGGRSSPTFAALGELYPGVPYRIVAVQTEGPPLYAHPAMLLPNLFAHFHKTPVYKALVVAGEDAPHGAKPTAIVCRRKGIVGGLIVRPGGSTPSGSAFNAGDLWMEPFVAWVKANLDMFTD